jgi:hypothetical protein
MGTSSQEAVAQVALFVRPLYLAASLVAILQPAKPVKVDSSFLLTTSAKHASVPILDAKHVVQTEAAELYALNVHLDFTKTHQQIFVSHAQLSDAPFVIRPIQASA